MAAYCSKLSHLRLRIASLDLQPWLQYLKEQRDPEATDYLYGQLSKIAQPLRSFTVVLEHDAPQGLLWYIHKILLETPALSRLECLRLEMPIYGTLPAIPPVEIYKIASSCEKRRILLMLPWTT
ncbi:hypothetical protein M422DRAFT_265853 [Sphaerobolus stellatus SS14]|uniref:Uncharacterized protein n=1 Tax=Sphaerobolus stellatus (strain SS14) TaxID=990650 RepID=A0A0C9UCG8_SPHS4|nr:hypothetical protein M422DRAFT_265853 [Sphaerobolus stellatus SS14]